MEEARASLQDLNIPEGHSLMKTADRMKTLRSLQQSKVIEL